MPRNNHPAPPFTVSSQYPWIEYPWVDNLLNYNNCIRKDIARLMAQGKNKKALTKRARKGEKGYPVATIVFYGPDNKRATKVVCSIVRYQDADADADADPMKKWFTKGEARTSEKVFGEILSFIGEHEVATVVMADSIWGCPHEEGIDYPEGESCPQCPFWAGRDRFTHERVH